MDGLDEEQLTSVHAPVGWSISQLLDHLTFDDEIFWGGAIVGGDPQCIALVRDGWQVPVTTGADAIAAYRRWSRHSTDLLQAVDLDAPPRWWPPGRSSPFRPFRTPAVAHSGCWWKPPRTPGNSTSSVKASTVTSTSSSREAATCEMIAPSSGRSRTGVGHGRWGWSMLEVGIVRVGVGPRWSGEPSPGREGTTWTS